MNKIRHIGFILDGNRRWAKTLKKSSSYGHKYGAKKIKDVLLWCVEKNIKSISMYIFSTENWNRSKFEINYLLNLILKYVNNNDTLNFFNKHNIRFIWTGLFDNLNDNIISSLKFLEEQTKNNYYNFQFLFNYGADKFLAHKLQNKQINSLSELYNLIDPYKLGKLDIVIRTGNTHRLSNFLLLEASYAELIFSNLYWPEYTRQEFENNLATFIHTKRNFGGN